MLVVARHAVAGLPNRYRSNPKEASAQPNSQNDPPHRQPRGRSIMSVAANKRLIREYVATWNEGRTQHLSNFWAPDMIHYTRSLKQTRDEVKNVVADFMTAFPDLHFEIDDIFGEGDRVVTRMTANATHSGAYLGYPPTGKKINCSVMGIARIEDGKIAEHWGVTDELAMMAQIGMLPEEFLAAMT
jgi:steroid delta-isomerase-like uncharacterized protein